MTTDTGSPVPINSRAVQILRNWRLLGTAVAGGCMLVVGITAIGFSDAYFTATSTSPANSITAGSLRMQLSQTGAIVDGTEYEPGVTRKGRQTVTILNGRGRLQLKATGLNANETLADVLRIVVTQIDPPLAQPLYDNTLRRLQNVDLGAFATADEQPAGGGVPATRKYEIQVQWPASQDDSALQGATVDFKFEWLMVSTS